MGRNAGLMRSSALVWIGIFTIHALCCGELERQDALSLTVIVILALVALFVGLRLYSVLGERTGHEQQPILRPAENEPRAEPRVERPTSARPVAADGGDMAFLPTAGPGVRAILAADPAFDVARFLEGAQAAYRLILESFWKGDMDAVRRHA